MALKSLAILVLIGIQILDIVYLYIMVITYIAERKVHHSWNDLIF